MPPSHDNSRKRFTRLAYGIAALLFISGCASNRVTRPCIDVTSANCSDIQAGELSSASPYLPVQDQNGDLDGDLGSFSASASTNTGSKMTLAQVARSTIANNPSIGIIRAQAQTAEAGIDIINVAYAPKVDFSVARGTERTYNFESEIQTSQTRTEASIRASQLLFDFGKTEADLDWATAVYESTVWRQQAQTDAILLEMVEAYLAVLELSMQIENSRINERAHGEMYRIIKLNADAGNATEADVQRIVVGLEGARTLSINLRSSRQNAASNFKRLTGLDPFSLQVPSRINPASSRLSIADIEGYATKDPNMLSLEWDIVGLEAQQLSLKLDYLPEISLNASARIQENVLGENPVNANGRVMISLTGQIYDGGERMAKTNQLLARIEEVKYRYRRALDQLEQDIEDSARILRTANEKRASIAERIAASKSVVSLYQQQFEAGTRTIFELLDAQRELFAAKGEQITSRFEVMRAAYNAAKLNGNLADVVLGRNT